MQTVTVEINDVAALKALQSMEKKRTIRIIDNVQTDTPALSGKPMSIAQFKAWVNEAENSTSISLKEAKSRWQSKRKKLLK